MNPSPSLPDNLINRLSRVYVDKRQFTNEKNETIDFERLVLEIMIKGEPFNIEFKLDRKDKAVLLLSDELRNQQGTII